MQARVRARVLPTFVNRGLIDNVDATEMRAWAHDDGSVTQVELITKNAALVPPPRLHRHRYSDVLAPNAPAGGGERASPAAVAPAPTSAATREAPRHRAVAR